ncbi:MAG TPA: RNase adapter RapZ, partial [Candidatus Polarisedimenticolia bacterium]|nr:RNase adapter RapZ [Candidatus Polarisedimenticolia bacterium]
TDLLAFLIPRYIREGKSYLTVAIGCTGGRHRSVAMVEAVSEALRGHGYAVKASHRDVEKE